MKKLISLFILSLAMILSIVFLGRETTNAALGIISLSIIPGDSSCVYGTSLNLGQHTWDYVGFNMTWEFPSSFYCIDFEWLESRSMTLKAPNNLTNGLQTISKENIFLKVNPHQVTQGSCSSWLNTTSLTSIWIIPWVIISKSWLSWEVCKIEANRIQIVVEVPPGQAIGYYTWELILNSPRSN